jgi:hypothetical protein
MPKGSQVYNSQTFDLTLQMTVKTAEALWASLTDAEKMLAIQAVLQDRVDSSLEAQSQ